MGIKPESMKYLLWNLIIFLILSGTTIQAQNYRTHKVKQGERIEDIAKRYNVTPFDIYALNPESKKELKTNSVLIIPKSRISTEPKVTIVKELDGFKQHKVKRKETLYSLSKRYNITEDDIKKHNTFLYADNLKKGDRLKIPLYKTIRKVEVVEPTKQYTVLPKEGKWRIAYKFGITIAALEALNPEMNEVLKESEIINVPNIDLTDENIIDDSYSYYKVLPKEGFYRLKLKLNIEQAELEKLNPGLKESGLKEGMILKIPFDSASEGYVVSDHELFNLTDSISDFNTKHIAIMLPFRLNRVTFDSIADTKRQIEKDPYLNTSLDFHSGALMALDSLKKLGISLKVNVYDTKNQISEVSHILNTNNFDDIDAVIGPLMPKNLDKVASVLRSSNIPVVSPITKDVQLYDNVFQSRPSDELLKNKTIAFVKANTEGNNILIVSDSKNTAVSNMLKREFNYAKQVYSRKNQDGEEANYVLVEDIQERLKPGKNIVFLETQNEGFASNVTSILNSLIQEENIEEEEEEIEILLTTTKNNKAFENDEVSNYNLSNLQFHFATIAKPYDEDENIAFVKQYEKSYGVTPNKMAVRGFDLTMDVVLRLVTSDDLFMSVNDAAQTEYIENKFAYKKELFGGYYNDTVYMVKYNDLKIVEVDQ